MNDSLQTRYEIVKEMGSGTMSQVYLARHKLLAELRILKVIDKASMPEAVFMAEPLLLKELSHPSIPRIFDAEEDGEKIYIIKEFIEGETLEDIIRTKGPFDEQEAVNILLQLAGALVYLHGRKPEPVIHRDIKPDNIVMTPQGRVVIIDFGISRRYKPDSFTDTHLYGNRIYSAPEIFMQGATDPRSDIYSLGLTFYKMLTGNDLGKPPYEVIPPALLVKGLSKQSDRIVVRATKKNPDLRFSCIQEIVSLLESKQKETKKRKQLSLALIIGAIAVIIFTGLSLKDNLMSPYKHNGVDSGEVFSLQNEGKEDALEFRDKALEKLLREMIQKSPDEPFYRYEAEMIKNIYFFGSTIINWDAYTTFGRNDEGEIMRYRDGTLFSERGDIETLHDLKHFKNLESLWIMKNSISDISALSDLKNWNVSGKIPANLNTGYGVLML